MKRNTIKKLSLLAFCAAGVMIASGGVMQLYTAKAASLTGVSVRDFYVSGAGVRLNADENGKGVRFHTLMSDEIYAKLGDGYTTGTLILPELLYNGDLSVTTDKVMDIDTTGMWYESETDGFMQSTAYVYGIPESNYGVKYVSVSYIKDNTGAYVYSAEGPATAMTDVAKQAIAEDETLTDVLTDYIVDEVTVTYVYEGNTQAQTYAYGAQMTPPEEANKTGYNVVWTMKNGQAWDFEDQTATGNVTLTANYTQKQSALQNPTASEEAAPEGYGCVSTAPFNQTDTSYMFADMDITGYTQLKFKAKGSVGTYLGSGSGYVGLSTDWREVIVTNNNDGTWKVTLTGYGDNFTISATNLKDVFVWTMWQSSAGTLYTTELQCVEKETPTSDLASFGYKIANTGLADATFFGEFDNVPVYKRTINVSSGGTFGIDFDFSAYDEVRFNFKHTGFGGTSFIGGNSAQISVATDTWYYVSLQKVDGAWDIYMKTDPQGEFTSPYGSGGRPDGLNTANLNGIISFYNWGTMNGEIYMTQVRGFQNVEEEPEEPVLWGANLGNALKNGANVDESAPDGYEKIYSAPFNQADTSYMFADMDITGYTQLKFKAKGSVGTYLGSMSGYIGLSTDWREVIVTNNNDGTWKVTLGAPYGDSFSISATNLKDVFVWTMWQSAAGTLYTTELRGEKIPLYGENLGCALKDGADVDESAPNGYEKIYSAPFNQADTSYMFAEIDISGYSQLKFKVKGSVGTYLGNMAGYIGLGTDWREVILTNNNDGTFTVTVDGYGDTFTRTATTLKDMFEFTMWQSEAGTLYATELRGEINPTVSLLNAKGIAVMDTAGTPGYHELQYAADELQHWAKTLLEKDLEIVTTNSIEDIPFGYFVIGYELARQAGLGEGNLTTDTGYRIENVDGRVYLYGLTKYGSLNAVYGLFEQGVNLTFFSDTVYTYDEGSDIVIEEGVYKEFNPSIDYNWAADGMMTMISGDYLNKVQTVGASAIIEESSYGSPNYPNWDYQRRLGFVNSWYILGGGWHNFTSLMPYETYGTSHPNWYAEITDWSGATVKTLKLSYNNFEMVSSVAAAFYTLIKADEAEGHYKTDYIFAPPDSSNWPTNSYGYSASQEYLLFMNKLAEYMSANYNFGREINLLMLAYNNTLVAPTDISLHNGSEVDVAVMYAPIQSNMYRELSNSTVTPDYYGNHTNSYYLGLLNDWQTLAGENKDKVYCWNYSAYYDNYFVPLDTITNMQSTYQTLANSGVKVLFDLGQTGDLVSSDFAALKVFLKGQLAKNVNAVLWTEASTLKGGLVEKFMNAYYGAGAEAMLTLLKTEMDWYKTLADEAVFYNGSTASTTGNEAVGHHSGGGQLLWSSKYWDDDDKDGGVLGIGKVNPDSSMLTTWYGYIQTALSAVEGDAELTRRINVESMPIRYLMYRMFSDYDLNNDGTDDNTKDGLIAFAKSLGIVAFTESGAIDSLA